MILTRLKLHCFFATLAALSIAAAGQERSSTFLLLPTPAIRGTVLAPNFRVADFKYETLDADPSAPDAPPDTASSTEPHQGLIKRSVHRIGQDQKRLYLAPFEAHNLKWDAIVLIGTGAFLAADRHIENNISHANFHAYQTTSNIALAGLASSLAGIYLYGAKTEHHHARETGAIELETLVNTFLIYAPMRPCHVHLGHGLGAGRRISQAVGARVELWRRFHCNLLPVYGA
jgi:hypothetical protein